MTALREAQPPRGDAARATFAPRGDAALEAAQELARWLPAEAERCVLSLPARVAADQRALVSLASPGDRLPWRLALPVQAYARADILAGQHTAAVEYLRVEERGAGSLREALAQVDRRNIQWESDGAGCAGELTCVPVRAELVDARTLRIATRHVPQVTAPAAEGRCARLLREHADAVEVSARRPLTVGERRELAWTDVLLRVSASQLERVTRRHFTSPALSARAFRQLLTGGEDLPFVAGTPVPAQLRRLGHTLELRATVSMEELAFALADQERLRAALAAARAGDEAEAVFREPERVIELVGQRLSALPSEPRERAQQLREVDALLQRARRDQPLHDGLARRHYHLRLELLHDARGALEIADAHLGAGARDVRYWELAQRAALARLDPQRLATELVRTFGYAPKVAASMARRLAREVIDGADYERVEWGLTTGQALVVRARRLRMASVRAARLSLLHLPRLLAAWARLSGAHGAHDLGVHILAFGERASPPRAAGTPWVVDTQVAGRSASVLGAATWEEGRLLEQGQALALRFEAGRLELVIGLDAIETRAPGALLALSGRVERGQLVLERVSKPLERVDWERLHRYLAAPLSRLQGSLFPPDELVVEAVSAADLEGLVRGIEDSGDVRCAVDAFLLRCGGGLGDPRAAYRALLRGARAVLGRDTDLPWSSGAP